MLMIREIALTQPSAVEEQDDGCRCFACCRHVNKASIPAKKRPKAQDVSWLEMVQFALRLPTPFR
jgi:hypothetical protein